MIISGWPFLILSTASLPPYAQTGSYPSSLIMELKSSTIVGSSSTIKTLGDDFAFIAPFTFCRLDRRRSFSTGFIRWSTAPHKMLQFFSSFMEITRIGISDVAESCFRFLRISQPLTPGSIMSRVITEGFSSRASKRASLPLETVTTLYPASESVIVKSSFAISSSSTTITRFFSPESPEGSIISGSLLLLFASGFMFSSLSGFSNAGLSDTWFSGTVFSAGEEAIFLEASGLFILVSEVIPHFKGNSNSKVEPFPGSLSAHTLPP